MKGETWDLQRFRAEHAERMRRIRQKLAPAREIEAARIDEIYDRFLGGRDEEREALLGAVLKAYFGTQGAEK